MMTASTDLGTLRRCGIYVRISKDRRNEAGVQRQEKDCRDLAERRGWSVVEVYSDNDREASTGKPRPAYVRMIEDMKAGRIDAVVGWHSDRIVRRPDELEDLIKIADEHDVLFAAVQVGNIDLSTASGRLVARLLGAAAKYETELKGERQRAQLRQRAHAGLPPGGGTRPFGYEPDRTTLRPAEATIVRELASRVLAGETVGSVTDWLRSTGVPTVLGGAWHPGVVNRMLTSPYIAALATWEGQIIGSGQWPAIISETEHRQLVALLKQRGGNARPRPRVALLTGLIWCGRCEYALVTTQRPRRDRAPVRSYACHTRFLPGRDGFGKACGRTVVKAEWVEDDIAERVIARLAVPANARRLAEAAETGKSEAGVTVELAELEGRLRQVGVDYADSLLGRTEFLAARDRLAARIRNLEHQLQAGAPRVNAPYGDAAALATWWETATLGTRQALIRQHVDRVTVGVHQGRRSVYDRSRVAIEWR